MNKTRILVYMGLFIAMHIIFARFLSFQTTFVRISFEFLPIALASIMFGPLVGAATGGVADILGMIIAPKSAYFPGFTLSAMLVGLIYGLILYKKPKTILRISFAVILSVLFVDIGLNTWWLTMITGKAASVFLGMRVVKSIVWAPVQIIMIHQIWKYAGNFIETKLKLQKV